MQCIETTHFERGWVALDEESLLEWNLFRDMHVDFTGIRWTNTVQQASILYSYILSYVRMYLQDFFVYPDISLCKAAQLWIVEESRRTARDLVFNFLSGRTAKKLLSQYPECIGLVIGVMSPYVMLCYVMMNKVAFANSILVCFLAGAGWRA